MKHFALTASKVILAAVVGLFGVLSQVPAAIAAPPEPLASCSVNITPHRVDTGQTATYTVQVTNTDSTAIDWVRLLAPSSNYDILNGQADGWFVNYNSEELLITNNQIAPGATLTYTLTVATNIVKTPTEYWTLFAASDGGDNPLECTGDTSAAIGLLGPPDITNIGVFNIGTDTATVFWTTDRPTNSTVEYGTTSKYGSSKTSAALATSHSLKITGLAASTGYHFRLSSSDGDKTAYSGDNTFITIAPAPVKTVTVPVRVVASDTTPPAIRLTTSLAKPRQTAPAISGVATDNAGLTDVEYSTDGGLNWLPVNTRSGPATNVAFAFTPQLTDDGTYQIQARATDVGGNRTSTATTALTIDRLPPRFGPASLAVGPQSIRPGGSGVIQMPTGVVHRLAVSLIGGPTAVTLTARQDNDPRSYTFALSQDPGSGLWTGIVSLAHSGVYQLTGLAIDGAGNRTNHTIATLYVTPPVYVLAKTGRPQQATATLYFLSKQTNAWSVWDGTPYGQTNPISLGKSSSFSLLAPPGTYYLKVEAQGSSVVTRKFTLTQPTPLSGVIGFDPPTLKLGPLTLRAPWSGLDEPPLRVAGHSASAKLPLGANLPLATLPTTAGKSVSAVSWYGKPTVLVSLATWSASSAGQLQTLQEIKGNSDVNVVPFIGQEPTVTVAAYQKIAGYPGDIVTDPDGLLSNTLTMPGTPVLYFLDRHGAIKKIIPGPQNASSILTNLSKI